MTTDQLKQLDIDCAKACGCKVVYDRSYRMWNVANSDGVLVGQASRTKDGAWNLIFWQHWSPSRDTNLAIGILRETGVPFRICVCGNNETVALLDSLGGVTVTFNGESIPVMLCRAFLHVKAAKKRRKKP